MEAALTLGFFRGTSATTFSPEKTLTRAEMVTVLHRMAGTPEVEAENPASGMLPLTGGIPMQSRGQPPTELSRGKQLTALIPTRR